MFIALYPVRNKLRLPRSGIILSLIFLCVLDCVRTFLIKDGFPSSILSLLTLAIQIGFYLFVVQQRIGKSIFFLLCLSNIASFNGMIAKCVEGIIFPSYAQQSDRWSFSLCLLIVELVTLIPLFLYIKKVYVPTIKRDKKETVWIVPATFYLIWYVFIFMNSLPTLTILVSRKLAFFAIAVIGGSLLIYHSIIRFVDEQNKNEALQRREYHYQLQLSKYKNLQNRIEETKKVRHDLRHHLNVIAQYVRDEKKQELLTYLDRCNKVLTNHTTVLYCDNYPINSLLCHFAARADNSGCRIQAFVVLPEEISIPNEELTILFGNLLENAVESVEKIGEETEISINCKLDHEFFYLDIRNPCTGKPSLDGNGFPVSQKGKDHGIGLRSVRDIVKQYEGMIEFDYEDNVFSVQIILPLKGVSH